MPFTIKDPPVKCDGCMNAHIVQSYKSDSPLRVCKLLGMIMGPVKTCNQFLPHVYGPVPVWMVTQALDVEKPKDTRKSAGFRKVVTKEEFEEVQRELRGEPEDELHDE